MNAPAELGKIEERLRREVTAALAAPMRSAWGVIEYRLGAKGCIDIQGFDTTNGSMPVRVRVNVENLGRQIVDAVVDWHLERAMEEAVTQLLAYANAAKEKAK